MAQQTINVGAAPNDGTGTPLRTAFQYTNSNFTELYTAVGPSGNNIVVPGTATITGNLTVDTDTFFVNSANNRVGVGTVSPSEALHINRASGNGVFTRFQDAANSNYIGTDNGNFRVINGASQDLLNIQQLGVFAFGDGAGGTRMTLNSTGLGVGVSPAQKLDIIGSLSTRAATTGANQNVISLRALNSDASAYANALYYANSQQWHYNGASLGMALDSSGNVISNVTGTAPTLAVNSQMVFNLTSNTNLRISVRGTDGTTRTANITLA
jgi:hypothetical protein